MRERYGFMDPGGKYAALAYYEDGTLLDAGLITDETPLRVAYSVAEWFEDRTDILDVFVTEGQQIYAGPRRADPNDLLPLAFMCGACEALVTARTHESILPRIWTKGTPKQVRINRLKKDLTPEELKVAEFAVRRLNKDEAHNVWDAIALGKWYLNAQK